MTSTIDDVAYGHPDEQIAVVIGSTGDQRAALRHAVELAARRGAPLDILQVLDDGDPLLEDARSHAATIDPVLHQLAVWGRLHGLAEATGVELEGIDHDLHVIGRFDDDGRDRLLDLLQDVTLTVIDDRSPLLEGTTPEQLALALASAAHCGVVVVPAG